LWHIATFGCNAKTRSLSVNLGHGSRDGVSLCHGSTIFRSDRIVGPETAGHARDAAQYITKLPEAEHDAKEWQAAMEALLRVAEHDGPTHSRALETAKAGAGSMIRHPKTVGATILNGVA
jgi:hypothetical protein